ncbi:MAG: hypothetical protein ACE5OZ_08070 [Candidatus Heimdallarchaeota archaeon]
MVNHQVYLNTLIVFMLMSNIQPIQADTTSSSTSIQSHDLHIWLENEHYPVVNTSFEIVLHIVNKASEELSFSLNVDINGSSIYSAAHNLAKDQFLTQPLTVALKDLGYYEITANASSRSNYLAYSWVNVIEARKVDSFHFWFDHPPSVYVNESFILSMAVESVGTLEDTFSLSLYDNESFYGSYSKTVEAGKTVRENVTMSFSTAGRHRLKLVALDTNVKEYQVESQIMVKTPTTQEIPTWQIWVDSELTDPFLFENESTTLQIRVHNYGYSGDYANVSLAINETVVFSQADLWVLKDELIQVDITANISDSWYLGIGPYYVVGQLECKTISRDARMTIQVQDRSINTTKLRFDTWLAYPSSYPPALVGYHFNPWMFISPSWPSFGDVVHWALYANGSLIDSDNYNFTTYASLYNDTVDAYQGSFLYFWPESGYFDLFLELSYQGAVWTANGSIWVAPLNFELSVDISQPYYATDNDSLFVDSIIEFQPLGFERTVPGSYETTDYLNVTLYANDSVLWNNPTVPASSGGVAHLGLKEKFAVGYHELYLRAAMKVPKFFPDKEIPFVWEDWVVWEDWTWIRVRKLAMYELSAWIETPTYIEKDQNYVIRSVFEERGEIGHEFDYDLSINGSTIVSSTTESILPGTVKEKPINISLTDSGFYQLVLTAYSHGKDSQYSVWGYFWCLEDYKTESDAKSERTTIASFSLFLVSFAVASLFMVCQRRKPC